MAYLIFLSGSFFMKYDIYGVYLVDFKKNMGGELSGKHYAIILTCIHKSYKTFLAMPITSKKAGKKYRNGFTIDCRKYQQNPTNDKAFAMADKIREVSKFRVYGKKLYDLDEDDISKLRQSLQKILNSNSLNISNLVDNYVQWLKQEITFEKAGDFYDLTTPFLNLNNDYLQIYIKLNNSDIYMTDDKGTVQTLLSNGLNISDNGKVLLNNISTQYDVDIAEDYEITACCSPEDFPLKKHMFIQCILRVNAVFAELIEP